LAPSFLGWLPDATPAAALLSRHVACCPAEPRARWEVFASPWLHAASESTGPSVASPASGPQVAAAGTGFVPHLTSRERQVLTELSRGATYADVAATLVVSENTVKTHVSAVYAKLGATRRSDALKKARALRLV
jgi:DNA-binding NarL/FixJ family response regulator